MKKYFINMTCAAAIICIVVYKFAFSPTQNTQTTQTYPTKNSEITNVYNPESIYISTTNDESTGKPEWMVTEFTTNGKKTILFPKNQIQTLLSVDEKGFIGIRETNGYQDKIVRINMQGEIQQTLYSAEINHYITGLASPDKHWIVFSDLCGITCKKKAEEAQNNLYSINTITNEVKQLYQDKNDINDLYYIPMYWSETEQNKVVLERTIEVGEGDVYPRNPLLLDINTGKTIQISSTQADQYTKNRKLLQPYVLRFYKKSPYIIYTNQPDTKEKTNQPTNQLHRFNTETKQDETLLTSPNWIELIP